MSETPEKKTSLRFFGLPLLLPYIKPYKKLAITMLLISALTGIVDILLPLYQQYAINHFIYENTTQNLWLFTGLYFITILFQATINFISTFQASTFELYLGRDMKRAAFNHLQTLSFSYFNRNSVGYIHARVMSDTNRIGTVLAWDSLTALWQGFYLIGAVVVMFLLDWKLALCVLIVLPVAAFLIAYFQKKLVGMNRRIRETNSEISGKFNEGITGVKTSKTLVIEDKIGREFSETAQRMNRYSCRTAHLRALLRFIVYFAASFALALVLWQGGLITVKGVMLIGTLSTFMSYAQGMIEPVWGLVDVFSNLVTVQVNIERFHNLVTTPSDVTDTPEVIEKYGDSFEPKKENWETIEGDITFDNVSFRYPDGEETVLEDFSLHVPKGTTVAIVGETGAGKSTLVNLVCRFFEPTKGRILIDGKDAKERSMLWLHSQIGYVLQTPHLFSGTIRENLCYGNPDATDEQIREAVRSVGADTFIERLENGYDSDVGEGGDLLSTGEKQLISFARAVLTDPAIFILDEATSSIDTVTEKLLQEATATLLKDRTAFVIAHRLSTVRDADVILAVKNGKIVEKGTHRELLKQKGYYYDLYSRQFAEESTQSALS